MQPAAGVSSYGWSEVRVIPNLCVLGDAAGVAAAMYVNDDNRNDVFFEKDDIATGPNCLQEKLRNLRSYGYPTPAILDKDIAGLDEVPKKYKTFHN